MGKEGKPGRRAKALRPMYRGYVCFSPGALHRHWYKQHAFLRGPSPEVSLDLHVMIAISLTWQRLQVLACSKTGSQHWPKADRGAFSAPAMALG